MYAEREAMSTQRSALSTRARFRPILSTVIVAAGGDTFNMRAATTNADETIAQDIIYNTVAIQCTTAPMPESSVLGLLSLAGLAVAARTRHVR